MKNLGLVLLCIVTGVSLGQAPANDLCQGALSLPAPGIYPGTNVSSTASLFGVGSCGLTGYDVWYTYTAAGTGNKLIASTCPPGSSTFSTGVDILTGTCFTATTAGCSATHCEQAPGLTGARAVVPSTVAGTTYLIRVRGLSNGVTGAFNLYVDELIAGPQPNGTCATPTPVIDGVNAGLTNFGEPTALAAGFAPGCGSGGGKDVFFSYLATGTGSTTIRTCLPAPAAMPALNLRDSIVAVYGSCAGGAPLACNDNGCSGTAGTGSALSTVSVATVAGTTYLIQVAGNGTGAAASEGNFDLEIIPPPVNDECSGALALQIGTNPAPPLSGFTYSMTSASVSAGWPIPSCAFGTPLGADEWFTFTPATAGIYQIDTDIPAGFTAGTLTDTTLELFASSACMPGPALACDDDSGLTGSGLLSLLTANLAAGTTYYVKVGDWGAYNGGTYYVNVTYLGPAASNDECSAPLVITTGPNGPFSNAVATTSAGSSGTCSIGYNDLFFAYTPSCASATTFSTGCNGFDTVLTVWDACAGTELVCNDNDPSASCGLSSTVTLNTNAGQTYLIRVASSALGTSGSFNVDVTEGFGLNWSSPAGPGTLQFVACGGAANGSYYMFISFVAGAFPNGWFYGIDITLGEIASQIAFGFPFTAPLNGAGSFTSPVFGGVPSGLTFYSVAFGVQPGSNSASANSGPKAYTVP